MEYYKYFDRRFFYVGLVIVVVGDIFGVMERKKIMINLVVLSCSIIMMCMLLFVWGFYIILYKCM